MQFFIGNNKFDLTKGLESFLFFCQRLEESLYHHTIDTYKSKSTNLHYNIIELISLLRDVKEGKLYPGTITYLKEEIVNRVNNNYVYLKNTPLILKLLKEKLSNLNLSSYDVDSLLTIAHSCRSELNSNYIDLIKDRIKIEICENENRRVLCNLANELAVELEINGFNRAYIFFETKKFFFDKRFEPYEIVSTDQILDFYERFNKEAIEWKVVFKCNDHYDILRHIFGKNSEYVEVSKTFEVSKDKAVVDKFALENNEYKNFVTIKKIQAKDQYGARITAKSNLGIIENICRFHDHNIPGELSDNCLIYNSSVDKYYILSPPPNPMSHTLVYNQHSPAIKKGIVDTFKILKGEIFDTQSAYSFVKAFDLHKTAMIVRIPEIQLINLWSALEAFVPVPDSGEKVRIAHYLSILESSLALNYTYKHIYYISSIIKSLSPDLKSFLKNNIDGDTWFNRSLYLVSCKEYDEMRSSFYKKLNEYPLLRFRIFQANEMFSSKKSIKRTINTHLEGTKIHIQRIYTLRNSIVHNAESIKYVDSLISNLHSYVDSIITSVFNIGINSPHKITIKTAVNLLKIQHQLYLKSLKGENLHCHTENCRELLFPMMHSIS